MYGMMLWKRESIYNSSINTMNINKNIYFIEIYQMFSYYQFFMELLVLSIIKEQVTSLKDLLY